MEVVVRVAMEHRRVHQIGEAVQAQMELGGLEQLVQPVVLTPPPLAVVVVELHGSVFPQAVMAPRD
jgi:hypothetical protein